MRLYNLERAEYYEVRNWIEENIKLTPYQKQKLHEELPNAPFFFMEIPKNVNNVWLRLTLVFVPFVLAVLVLGLPINFIITGNWGYSEKMRWYGKWINKLGFN